MIALHVGPFVCVCVCTLRGYTKGAGVSTSVGVCKKMTTMQILRIESDN